MFTKLRMFWIANKWALLIMLLLVPLYTVLCSRILVNRVRAYGVDVSVSDLLLLLTEGLNFAFGFVLYGVFFNIFLLKREYSYQMVVRQVTKGGAWLRQCVRICGSSLLLSFYMTVCAVVSGYAMTGRFINWNASSSLYYFYTSQTMHTASGRWVCLAFFLYCVLSLLVMSLVTLLIKWQTGKSYPGLILVIAVASMEHLGFVEQRISVFFTVFSIDYMRWSHPKEIFVNFFYPLGLALIVFFVGYRLALRKDFLGGGYE